MALLMLSLAACKPEGYRARQAAQAIAEPLIKAAMTKTTPGYEAVDTRLRDSVMVDLDTFVKLEDWDEKTPVTPILYRNSLRLMDRLTESPVMEANLCAADRDQRHKTIVAYYVYEHQYRYTKNGHTYGDANLLMYSPLKQKVYLHNPFPLQTLR
jgi:hypothetical protein